MTVVLVVEDNPRNLKLVRDLLAHAGYDTLEATTGEDGLALARAHRPDLVLMDVQLPGMDGTQDEEACNGCQSEGSTGCRHRVHKNQD